MTFLEEVGGRIRERRKTAGMTQEDLAAKSGLDRTYVSATERGRRNIGLLNLARIAQALQCSAADLLPPTELTADE